MDTMQRYLDRMEETFQRIKMFTPLAFEYRGDVDPNTFSSAINTLAFRYPVLRGRIIKDRVGYLLKVTDTDSSPRLTVIDGAPNGPQDSEQYNRMNEAIHKIVYERENRVFAPMLFRGKSRGYFLFGIDHSLIDATALAAYTSEFWKAYCDAIRGSIQRLDEYNSEIPFSPSEMLMQHWHGYSELEARVYRKQALPHATAERNFTVKKLEFELDNIESQQFIKACKERGVTVGSYLAAAMAVELRSSRPRNNPETLRIGTPLDYRKSVKPPIKPLDTTCLSGFADIDIDVSWGDDASVIGKRIRAKLDDELLRRDVDPLNPIEQDKTQIDIVMKGGINTSSLTLPDGLKIVDTLPIKQVRPGANLFTTSKAPKICIVSNTFNSKLRLTLLIRDDVDETVVDKYRNRVEKFAEG